MSIFLSAKISLGELLKKSIFPKKLKIFSLEIDPTLLSALVVSLILLLMALVIRLFIIPRFSKDRPSNLQIILESTINFFDKIAKDTAKNKASFVGAYIYMAGLFIFTGTLIELLGFRPVMSSINTCIAISIMTFSIMVYSSIRNKGIAKGTLSLVKDITLPISMTFRLFGSILSGFLIMQLLYYFIWLKVGIPAVMSVMFTLFHAIIQAYIFAVLSSLFIGETLEKKVKLGG